jgi:septum formation protein
LNPLPELILASTSPYRRQLLERLRLPFRAIAPQVDEAHCSGEAAAERAARLALAKAEAVSAQYPGAVVIGSDQVALCEGVVLDKPGTAATAVAQLHRLSGRSAVFHSAVAVVHRNSARQDCFTHLTEVRFRTLSSGEIERYVAADAPLDCAGSFRSEALGSALFEAVLSDDPTGLVGLPLIRLASSLRVMGYALP